MEVSLSSLDTPADHGWGKEKGLAEVFRKLTDVEHVLARPGMYVGSTSMTTERRWFSGMEQEVRVCPGLLKVCFELVDNSLDEHIRSGGKAARNIKVDVSSDRIRVSDDGRGIPVVDLDGEPRPLAAWTSLRAGTSFTTGQTGPSSHGVGACLLNIFSKKFSAGTSDGKKLFRLECSDGMKKVKWDILPSRAADRGTWVEAEPDFSRFGASSIDRTAMNVMRERLRNLSVAYPSVRFVFNDEEVNADRDDFMKSFGHDCVWIHCPSGLAGVFIHDFSEVKCFTSVNGLELAAGGTHVSSAFSEILPLLSKAVKKQTGTEIPVISLKKDVGIVLIMTGFPDPAFDSQSKDRLVNPERDVKPFLSKFRLSRLITLIQGKEGFTSSLAERHALRRELKGMQKINRNSGSRKIRIEKHVPALGKDPGRNALLLVEGDSAASGIKNVRDVQTTGLYAMRGVPRNAFGISPAEAAENREFDAIAKIMGLKFSGLMTDGKDFWKQTDKAGGTPIPYSFDSLVGYWNSLSSGRIRSSWRPSTYGTVAVCTDRDHDGAGFIRPLTLMYLFMWPELFQQGRIMVVDPPLVVAERKKTKIMFQSIEEHAEWAASSGSGWDVRYCKGLGSYRPDELEMIVSDRSKWRKVVLDDVQVFRTMFSGDAGARREVMGI